MEQRVRVTHQLLFAVSWLGLSWLALARFHTFHNVTFDLAFYSRIAWGMARLNFWEPIVSAHILGLHVSPVLVPLGLLARVVGHLPELLLVTQALAIAACVFPLGKVGSRQFGVAGSLLLPTLFVLHPTITHVASYEFHPSTIAVLPLAWLLDSLETKNPKVFVLAAFAILMCREDLALLTLLASFLFFSRAEDRPQRKAARWVGLVSIAWFIVLVLFLQQLLAPPAGSVELHFGRWGDSPIRAVLSMATSPVELTTVLLRPRNLHYLLVLFGTLCFLPLLSPRSLFLVAPILGANLISEWPTTTDLDSHYSSLLVPVLLVAAVRGGARIQHRVAPRIVLLGLLFGGAVGHMAYAQTPLSVSFNRQAFRVEPRSKHAAAIVNRIPPDASVQAPYAFLPHLAERLLVAPAPPPDRNHDFVILEAPHRTRFAGSDTLLRTAEEPVLRNWLAKPDQQLIAAEGRYLLLQRNEPAREGPLVAKYFRSPDDPDPRVQFSALRLTECLAFEGWDLGERASEGEEESSFRLLLALRATGPCPADLAVRIGTRIRPRRTDLLFDGFLNPANLAEGDRLWSEHEISTEELRALREGRMRLGLVRESGARPQGRDPVSVRLPLGRSRL